MTNAPRAQSDVEWLRDQAREQCHVVDSMPDLDSPERRADITRLLAIADELEKLRALCPSLVDLDANEALTPDSAITVAVGYLHTLLEKDARIAELQTMLEVGCDVCSGAHHNNQHDLLESLAASRAENARKDEEIAAFRADLFKGFFERATDAELDEWVANSKALRAGQQKGEL